MYEWSVLIEAEAGAGSQDNHDIEDLAEGLTDALVGYGASVSFSPTSWSARFDVVAATPRFAVLDATEVLEKAASNVGMPDWPWVRTEAVRVDVLDRELARPVLPDLVGTQEVTEMMQVSRQRLHELRNSDRFPAPMIQLAAGPVWLKTTVTSFLNNWERKVGRPPADAKPASTAPGLT